MCWMGWRSLTTCNITSLVNSADAQRVWYADKIFTFQYFDVESAGVKARMNHPRERLDHVTWIMWPGSWPIPVGLTNSPQLAWANWGQTNGNSIYWLNNMWQHPQELITKRHCVIDIVLTEAGPQSKRRQRKISVQYIQHACAINFSCQFIETYLTIGYTSRR